MKKTPAAEQFAALGLNNLSDWTPAMNLAVKQKWAGLPVEEKVADLRAQLAALVAAPPIAPSLAEVKADLLLRQSPVSDDDAAAELKRIKRNAAVNHWRSRNQIQAAIDARDLKFAALRAKKGTRVAPPAAVSGDDAPVAVAS